MWMMRKGKEDGIEKIWYDGMEWEVIWTEKR